MCLPVKLKKNVSSTAIPAENCLFQAILDAFLMIMIIFFCKFLELYVPTHKTEKTAVVPPSAADFFFAISRRIN